MATIALIAPAYGRIHLQGLHPPMAAFIYRRRTFVGTFHFLKIAKNIINIYVPPKYAESPRKSEKNC